MMSANDFVADGGLFHAKAGEISLLMQVYSAGMDEPFLKAGLVMDRVIGTSVD